MPTPSSPAPPNETRSWAPLACAIVVAALGFLPFANWIGGGPAAPWYSAVAKDWAHGLLIVGGSAAVLTVLSRRTALVWRDGALTGAGDLIERRPTHFGIGVALVALVLYAVIAVRVLSARPLLIDELVQLIQARTFAQGRLWLPAPAHPEFFSVLNLVDIGGRQYAQFPAGGPALLSLGVVAGVPWLVGPLCGAISVVMFWQCVRVVEHRVTVAAGATLLFALAPFALFMSASHMNHVPTVMWLMLALLGVSRVIIGAHPLRWSFVAGVGLGLAATVRPADAMAFAIPVGVWFVARAITERARWRHALAAGTGVAIPLGVLLAINAATTGAPLLFGYEVLWGKTHALGFHAAPYGSPHTPARGIELINLYFLQLQTYLFESPVPSLVPVIAALALARRLRTFDRILLAACALLVASYFAYWHDGFFLGPRFVYPLLPALALWTARLPSLVREQFGGGGLFRGTIYAYVASAAIAVTMLVPARARDYARGFAPMRQDYASVLRAAGVKNAVVFVRESWGSQIVARLWALGVSRPQTERLYRGVDACQLESMVSMLEHSGSRDGDAVAALAPLLADSSRVVPSTISPDASERMLPGSRYTATCSARVAEDRDGFTLLAPLLAMDVDGNIFARDLHGRNARLLAAYPGRAAYLLRPRTADVGAPLQVVRLTSPAADLVAKRY